MIHGMYLDGGEHGCCWQQPDGGISIALLTHPLSQDLRCEDGCDKIRPLIEQAGLKLIGSVRSSRDLLTRKGEGSRMRGVF